MVAQKSYAKRYPLGRCWQYGDSDASSPAAQFLRCPRSPALTGATRMGILAAMKRNPTLPIAVLAALLLAGCADTNYLVGYEPDENFLSFNHPFTDTAAADVRTRAERLCGLRKQAVLQTSRSCSLAQCTTNFQCIDAADAAKYGK
jgi:hypothetical protein